MFLEYDFTIKNLLTDKIDHVDVLSKLMYSHWKQVEDTIFAAILSELEHLQSNPC